MSIANDWDVNYSSKVISHVDGVLSYDNGDGTQPAVGQMVIGNTSGAIGKILARTGNAASGTLTLTNVVGQFANNENLYVLSELLFDTVNATNKALIQVGATITGDSSASTMVIKFIEYNIDGVAGHGKFYGRPMSAAFTNDEDLKISTLVVCKADLTGTDNDTQITTTLVDGTLAVPGTASTNNSVIIHYDAGTIAIPEDAHIKSGSAGATGYAQRVFGSVATGSVRVVDSDTSGGSWTNDQALRVLDVVYYDALVAGKVFSAGDIVKAVSGASPDAVGRVLAVIDDGDNTGKLILAGMSGTWDNDNEIHVKQADDSYVKYGEVEDSQPTYLEVATLNLPGGVRSVQRSDQGGIFPTGSLNIVRSWNALYTYLMDLYDELSALDDLPPMDGDVKDQLYTILNDYVIPDLSFRFLEKGSFKDTANNNIGVGVQTVGAIADIGNHGYYYSSTNPTPQPDMYIEQDGAVIRQDWLEGNLDVTLKVKTSTNPAYINPTVPALGQLINSAKFTVHLRPYGRTYDSNEVTKLGGIATVALGNAKDLNNTTGQYRCAFSTGGAGAFTVGEEITTTGGKRGVVLASDSGASGNVDYALKSGTNFVNTDVITGSISAKSATVADPSNLVAGYGTNIKAMTVDRRFTGGTTAGTFVIGETVTQTGTGATGFVLEDDSGTIYVQDNTGTFNGTGLLTGGVSGATNTPTATAAYTTVPKDIGGGVGDKNYTAVVSANITNANARPVSEVYEWFKFLTRAESQLLQGGPGSTTGKQGRIYRRLDDTFAEVRGASPYGTKAGSLVIGAQGVFIEKLTLATADLRNIQLVDNDGNTWNPPNLQTMEMVNLVAGVAVAIYRSTGSGLETILLDEFQVGTVGGGYNQSGDAYIKVAANVRSVSPLPNDVPDTGVVHVLDPKDTGNYLRFVYDAVDRTNNWFHLQQGIGQNTIGAVTGSVDLTASDNTYVVPIEKAATGANVSNILQYVADIPLYAVARIKGKKPFKTTATFSATGVSIGAVLNSDNVVNLP
jgi:hypothetical protein